MNPYPLQNPGFTSSDPTFPRSERDIASDARPPHKFQALTDLKMTPRILVRKFRSFVYKRRVDKRGKKHDNQKQLNRAGIRKIFIDAGAHAGESISVFLDEHPALAGSTVYLFEPNPEYAAVLKEMESHSNYQIIYRPEAVWTKNEELSFYIANDQWGDYGSTLLADKKEKLALDRPLKVKAIDFAEFLKSNVSADDYVVVKLDIEGAEYQVIEHLIRTGTINLVNELRVEWHDSFFPDIDHFSVRYKLSGANVAVYIWEF